RRPHPLPGHQAGRHDPCGPRPRVKERRHAGPLSRGARFAGPPDDRQGLAYPAIVTGIAQVAFPYRANGSLVVKDGKTLGSELIGQPFDDPKYFWARPSATTPFAYNAGS